MAPQPAAQAPATPAPTIQTPATPTATLPTQQQAPAQQKASQITMPANGSVVDLLNMAGQDSSYAARAQLAQQYGIQSYKGTAAQNQELSKKFLEAYNQLKGTTAPQSGAEARTAISAYQSLQPQEAQQDPTRQFMDMYSSMNPIEANIFQQLSGLLSSTNTQQSMRDLYAQEVAAQGLPALNMELADINRIMEGTESDIRDEITRAGGMITESQVQALVQSRNKNLLKKANYLSNVISAKNDYIDNIVSLTQADRKQVSDDLDRKLGITKTLFDMSQSMQNASRENYRQMISQVGYDGLVNSVSSQRELEVVAQSLGLTPKTLLQLSTVPTSAQRQEELQKLNYQLSVDKFNEDKRQFGMQYALEQQRLANQVAAQKIAASSASQAQGAVAPYTVEKANRTLQFIGEIKPMVSTFTVGPGSLLSYVPGTAAANLKAKVTSLEAAISFGELAEMRDASKTGGALGNVANKELELLGASLGALDRAQSPSQFADSLNKIETSVYRWNAQKLAMARGYDYSAAKRAGWSDAEIYKYLTK